MVPNRLPVRKIGSLDYPNPQQPNLPQSYCFLHQVQWKKRSLLKRQGSPHQPHYRCRPPPRHQYLHHLLHQWPHRCQRPPRLFQSEKTKQKRFELSKNHLPIYSRVHFSSDEVFSKILKKPSIVQKKMIPHMKASGILNKIKHKKKEIKN